MKIRALDASGDWTFGQGKGSYLAGINAVFQDIDTALQILLGEAFWNMSFGVDWFNLIGGEAPIAQQNIILQCRQVIISRVGVTKINSVAVKFENYRRTLHVEYDISTVFGRSTNTFIKGFNNVN
jgi:hypothetical protein